MRYYKITIKTKDGSLVQPSSMKNSGVDSTFTSYVNNQTIGGALNVEIDFPIVTYDVFQGGAHLAVWGLSLKEIAQSFDLNGCSIVVEAGFQKGLPLATAAAKYAGIILQGMIFQAYGNWVGTNQKIDLIIMPSIGTQDNPVNIQFKSQANEPMSVGIKQALTSAFPGFNVNVNISDDFKFSYEQTDSKGSLPSFATWIKELSQAQQFKGIKTLSGTPYDGVSIALRGKDINVYDGTKNYGGYTFDNPQQIAFQDIIGQPTWIDPATMNFKTVMRSDLNVGDFIKMPEKLGAPYVVLAPNAAVPGSPASEIRNTIQFQGKYVIVAVHHFGNFRQADAASWVTTYDCVIVNPPGAT